MIYSNMEARCAAPKGTMTGVEPPIISGFGHDFNVRFRPAKLSQCQEVP